MSAKRSFPCGGKIFVCYKCTVCKVHIYGEDMFNSPQCISTMSYIVKTPSQFSKITHCNGIMDREVIK
jgi:hypothetical protein